MHNIAEGLINDNGISTIALAFFSALFAALSAGVVGIFQVKSKAIEARNVALETKKEAEQARLNTTNLSNGFADGVDSKLNRIIDNQTKLNDRLQNHLEWHVENPNQRG